MSLPGSVEPAAAPRPPEPSSPSLYLIEADITGRPAADRQAQHQARSQPLLDDLKTWMEAQRRRASSKTALGKALRYALVVGI